MSKLSFLHDILGIPDNVCLEHKQYKNSNGRKNLEKVYSLIAKNLPIAVPKNLWLNNLLEMNTTHIYEFLTHKSWTHIPISIGDLINYAFVWKESPEGHAFWSQLCDKYEHKSLHVKYKWGDITTPLEITKMII